LLVKRTLPVVAAAMALLVASACSGASGQATLGRHVTTTSPNLDFLTTTTTTAAAPLPWFSLIGVATVPTLQVFDDPALPTPSRELPNPWVFSPEYPDQTVPQVFQVQETRADGWTRVLLPVRPNGSSGWVRTSDLQVTPTDYRVRVELGAHTITVTQGPNVLYSGTVAIGAPETPTPTGNYFVRVKIKAIDPTTAYGPYAWGLSSHSDVLESFNGGDGEIGIHGNNDASVLGQDVSHGCVRMDNAAITDLTARIPLGTPVEVVP
jgi:lipoprotein-anchoring transpeptidase ErfK/SrfK